VTDFFFWEKRKNLVLMLGEACKNGVEKIVLGFLLLDSCDRETGSQWMDVFCTMNVIWFLEQL